MIDILESGVAPLKEKKNHIFFLNTGKVLSTILLSMVPILFNQLPDKEGVFPKHVVNKV